MPLREDQVEDLEESHENVGQKVHNAVREAIDPVVALNEMKEGDYQGQESVAFSSSEVVGYVKKKMAEAAKENPESQNIGDRSKVGGAPDAWESGGFNYIFGEEVSDEELDEWRQNLGYINDQVSDDGVLGSLPLIGSDEYSDEDFESYVKEQLWNSDQVEERKRDGTTYFEVG